MNIISVSRRTDIPAFYAHWFIHRVREGRVRYANPFGGQEHELSLRPEDVHAFVFWSKNYGPFLKYLPELEAAGYDFYFHFTINGLPRAFENLVISAEEATRCLHKLADCYGPKRVLWRFDPIIISDITGTDYHIRHFEHLASGLQGATERCYFSFVCLYAKVRRNLQGLSESDGILCYEPSSPEKMALVKELVEIAGQYRINLYTCCDDSLAVGGVKPAQCVDGELLYELFPHKPRQTKINPTRKGCRCVVSRDIGAYDTCPHGCVYCYANMNKDLAYRRFKAHNPTSDILAPTDALLKR